MLTVKFCYCTQALLVRLAGLGLPRAFGPNRLLIPEDEEEVDNVDTEQILTRLSGKVKHGCLSVAFTTLPSS